MRKEDLLLVSVFVLIVLIRGLHQYDLYIGTTICFFVMTLYITSNLGRIAKNIKIKYVADEMYILCDQRVKYISHILLERKSCQKVSTAPYRLFNPSFSIFPWVFLDFVDLTETLTYFSILVGISMIEREVCLAPSYS